jgi:bifunctional UDP-N-acetylglucosamine pyrophosphorylase/glucosamine-1-phosphate N-acetyltransferase
MKKNNPKIFSIILAAGKGTRMNSNKPKVLHHLGGKPLLMHVLEIAEKISQNTGVVVGHKADLLIESIESQWIKNLKQAPIWIHQEQQLGTGHAVKIALQQLKQHIEPQDIVLILYGDVPLIRHSTLKELISLCHNHPLVLLSALLEKPKGYGRIIRDKTNSVMKIVEHKDASAEQKLITEVNSGILATTYEHLENWVNQLKNDNKQQEFYLTDIVALCVSEGGGVGAYCIEKEEEIKGINSQIQRAELERTYQVRKIKQMADEGLGVADFNRLDIRGNLSFGEDVFIDIGVIIEGEVVLEKNVTIGAHCILKDCHIGANTIIKPYTTIEQSICGTNCIIGPYARLRPENTLKDNVHIGNFVEVKKSSIEKNSKVNHLSYIGDAHIGTQTNIGAGTITCNYDGQNKHQTDIGNNAFIGSGTQLVAPVKIGDNATIGAGSTITHDVKENTLGLSRPKQTEITNWKPHTKS